MKQLEHHDFETMKQLHTSYNENCLATHCLGPVPNGILATARVLLSINRYGSNSDGIVQFFSA